LLSSLGHRIGLAILTDAEAIVTDARVRQACVACFPTFKSDCSGFAKDVAQHLGVSLDGMADDIVQTLRNGGTWTRLTDGAAAAQAASDGKLVLGGLKGGELRHPQQHGHIVVVVSGDLNRGKYPHAYWGQLGGVGQQDQTINWAWTEDDRDHVTYAAHDLA
jgi:hypothetical protein